MIRAQHHPTSQAAWGIKDPSELLDIKGWGQWTVSRLQNVITTKYSHNEEAKELTAEQFDLHLDIDPRQYINPRNVLVLPLHTRAPTAISLLGKLSTDYFAACMNRQDEFGFTPLHIAAHSRNLLFVGELLSQDTNPNRKDMFDSTPLHIAATMGYKRIANSLVKYGANLTSKDKFDNLPVHLACQNGHTDLAISLIKQMNVESLNQRNLYGNTPLHLAARHLINLDKHKIVAELISRNVNINAPNNAQQTPLIDATKSKSVDCARLLVQAGADKNIKDCLNQTALDWANVKNYQDIISFLQASNVNEKIPVSARHNNSGVLFGIL